MDENKKGKRRFPLSAPVVAVILTVALLVGMGITVWQYRPVDRGDMQSLYQPVAWHKFDNESERMDLFVSGQRLPFRVDPLELTDFNAFLLTLQMGSGYYRIYYLPDNGKYHEVVGVAYEDTIYLEPTDWSARQDRGYDVALWVCGGVLALWIALCSWVAYLRYRAKHSRPSRRR